MSGAHRRRRTITIRWRSAVAMVPAAVLVVAGVAIAQSGTPSAVADRRSVPAVPRQPLTQPDRSGSGVEPASEGPQPADPGLAPGLELPLGTVPGSSQPVRLDRLGIPAPALAAYRLAAQLVSAADAACGVDWALVGAIGRVESDHARSGGNVLDAAGVAQPGIIGIPLDGRRGTATIYDTDGGRWDRDTVYDRAVGPMQFIPGTWRTVGSDADGDGVRNPQDIEDAATSTAVYLCSGPGDLRQSADLYQAVRRYNNSDSYARTVIAIADAYRRGVTELPASSLPAARGAFGGGTQVVAAGQPQQTAAAADPRTSAAASTRTSGAGGGAGAGSSSTSGSAPQTGPTPASAPPAAASSSSSIASLVTSIVTSTSTYVTGSPTVVTLNPCVQVLGIPLPVCTTTTTVPVTRTSTTTRTVTQTR